MPRTGHLGAFVVVAVLGMGWLPAVPIWPERTPPSASCADAAPSPFEVLWEAGKLDGTPAELALGEREEYSRFPELFPEDPRFEVGKSDPAKAFPYIHPGPMDAWAGSKAHALTLAFDLATEPEGAFLLRVDLCRSHYAYPPTLSVALNGAPLGQVITERDGHRQTKYLRAPASSFRRGANEIRIENASGSWAVYDGLRLVRFPRGEIPDCVEELRLKDTPYFREVGGALFQVVRVEVGGLWDGEGTFRLNGPGIEREIPATEAAVDSGLHEILIPPPPAPVEASCELRRGGKVIATSPAQTIVPHRRWTVYAALKTHYDLGYTHPIDEMLRNAAGPMLEKILEYCDATRDSPPDQRFRWIYPTWVLGKIRSLLDPAGRARLEKAIHEGAIGWNAAPFTLHSYFCGIEDMVRAFYPSVALGKEFGKTVRWAKQTDVPGHTRFLPQVLASSGIRLLQIGANNGVRGVKAPLLFRWQGPDGSRVLTQLTDGYGWGYDEGRLLSLEKDPSYPYDVFLALYVTGDNVGPADLIEVARTARAMGERYAYPRIRIGPVEEFVGAVESRFAEKVPVLKTELNDWWIHGVASMAREVSLARRARELLPAAEKLWSIAAISGSKAPYPARDFAEAYEQSLLFSEHTWGMAGFKPEPQPPAKKDLETNQSPEYVQMRRSWEVKGDEARAAWRIAGAKAGEGLQALGAALGLSDRPGQTILVFNPLNWARSDIVRIPRAKLKTDHPAIIEIPGGKEVPWQVDGEDLAFIVQDVPPVGHAAFKVVPSSSVSLWPPRPDRAPSGVFENARYRVAAEAATGAVTSIVDLSTGAELVDGDAAFRLGQYVYEGMERIEGAGWHGSPYRGKGTGKLVPRIEKSWIEDGPVFTRFVAVGSLPVEGFPVEIGSVDRVVQTVTLPRDLDWIECEVKLAGKRPTALAEQGNVAFPLRVKDGKFRLELLGSVVDPAADLQDMSNHDAYAVQHWVDVSGPAGGVTWSPVDTTIVTLGDFNLFRWDPKHVPGKTHIFANGLNNGWSTNFQEWQGGDFRFRFRLRSHEGDWVRGNAPRFGRETAQPLLAATLEPAAAAGSAAVETPSEPPAGANRASHLTVDAAHTALINFKRAEDEDGFIIRLLELTGERDAAHIAVPGRPIRSAARVLATEEPLPPPSEGALEVKDGAVALPVGPFALETVRIKL